VKSYSTSHLIIPYLFGLLSAPWRFSIVFLSSVIGVSHDHLTRTLQLRFDWFGVLRKLLIGHDLTSGYLIIDETEVDKSYAKHIQGCSWYKSYKKKHSMFGLHLVVLVWSDGKQTIPLGWQLYQKGSGITKIDLALKLLRYGVETLKIEPEAVLFDAFYASERILKYLVNNQLVFCSQLPKNRLFNHQQLKTINKNRPYWDGIGTIKGGIHLRLVKNRKKYYVTNNHSLSRKGVLCLYQKRWVIEEFFRVMKSQLGMENCQARSIRAQENHIGSCFMLFVLLQDMAEKTQMTVYQIKQRATSEYGFIQQTDLMRLLAPA